MLCPVQKKKSTHCLLFNREKLEMDMIYSKFLNLFNHNFQEDFKVIHSTPPPLPDSQDLSREESPHPSSLMQCGPSSAAALGPALAPGGPLCVPQDNAEIKACQCVCFHGSWSRAKLAGMWGKLLCCSCTGSRRKGTARNDHKVGEE